MGASRAPNATLGASDAPNATLGASHAPNATLGASHAPNATLGASHAPNATLGRYPPAAPLKGATPESRRKPQPVRSNSVAPSPPPTPIRSTPEPSAQSDFGVPHATINRQCRRQATSRTQKTLSNKTRK
ncbi:hypothetical protein CU254_34775 [Amycolatopsis sp. AA4]|nr:hypothetical protein CU254_34775 [Amycolatopsis sp. AA4]